MSISAGAIRASQAFIEILAVDNTKSGLRSANQSIASSIGGIKSQLMGLASSMKMIGMQSLALSGAIATGLGLAVKEFAGFDDRMRRVSANMNASASAVENVTAHARKLGATTAHTATQIAVMMHELTKGGIKSVETLKSTTDAVQTLARAAEVDGGHAADAMINVMKVFKLGPEDAANIADSFTTAALSGPATFEDLASSMTFAAKAAADVNMTVDETLALLAALGNVGIKGSIAGTAVRRVALISASDADNLKEIFGVDFKDSEGDLLNLFEVFKKMDRQLEGLGSADRISKMREGFRILGFPLAQLLSASNLEIERMFDNMKNGVGSAKRVAEEVDAGIGGAFRILKSAMADFGIELGRIVSEDLMGFVKGFTQMLNTSTKFIASNPNLIQQLQAIGISLAGIGITALAIGTAITIALGAFTLLGGTIVVASSAISGFLALLSAPLLAPLMVAMVAGVGGAVVTIGEEFDNLIALGKKTGKLLGEAFGRIAGDVKTAFESGDIELAFDIITTRLLIEWKKLVAELGPALEKELDRMEMIFKARIKGATYGVFGYHIQQTHTNTTFGKAFGINDKNAEPISTDNSVGVDVEISDLEEELEKKLRRANELRVARAHREEQKHNREIQRQKEAKEASEARVAARRGDSGSLPPGSPPPDGELKGSLSPEGQELMGQMGAVSMEYQQSAKDLVSGMRDQLSGIAGFMGTFSGSIASRQSATVKELSYQKQMAKLAEKRNTKLDEIMLKLEDLTASEFT